jgi:hypothetical protein
MGQSRRQIEDVAGILQVSWDSLDHAYIRKWVEEMRLESEWKSALDAAELTDK